jgi:pantoate--beta-alanine ligase
LLAAGFNRVDYFELTDVKSLAVLDHFDGREARLLAAGKVGKTRLIDNLAL